MTAPIEYVDELDPLLSRELPVGWVRALAKHPLQAVDGEPTEIDRMFAQDLSPGLPDEPISTQVLFIYLHGYDPSMEQPMNQERRVTIGYFGSEEIQQIASQSEEYRDISLDELDGCYVVQSESDRQLAITVDEVEDWLTQTMSTVETEMDDLRRFWVVLSDIHGLGQAGISNLFEEYGTIEKVRDATEGELTEVPYITDDLAPEVLTACEQWNRTVPEAPGDEVAREAADPLAIDTSQLRPLGYLFED
jgi:hypothetical protein